MALKIYTYLVLACLAAGIGFSTWVVVSCEFMEANGVYEGTTVTAGKVGVFRYSLSGTSFEYDSGGECVDYRSRPSDGWHRGSQVCSSLALFVGIALFVTIVIRQCCCPIPCSGILVSLMYITVQVMQACTWLIFNNDFCNLNGINCKWSDASTGCLLASVMYFAAGCFNCCMESPKEAKLERKADKAEKKAKEAEKRAEAAEERLDDVEQQQQQQQAAQQTTSPTSPQEGTTGETTTTTPAKTY